MNQSHNASPVSTPTAEPAAAKLPWNTPVATRVPIVIHTRAGPGIQLDGGVLDDSVGS